MCDGLSVLLHVRCGGCTKLYQQSVALPPGVGAPSDGDELMEYPQIRELSFRCPKCEAPYAEIAAFKVVQKKEAA